MLKDYKKPEEKPKWASISPDGETIRMKNLESKKTQSSMLLI